MAVVLRSTERSKEVMQESKRRARNDIYQTCRKRLIALKSTRWIIKDSNEAKENANQLFLCCTPNIVSNVLAPMGIVIYSWSLYFERHLLNCSL